MKEVDNNSTADKECPICSGFLKQRNNRRYAITLFIVFALCCILDLTRNTLFLSILSIPALVGGIWLLKLPPSNYSCHDCGSLFSEKEVQDLSIPMKRTNDHKQMGSFLTLQK